jgi:hypothetical protein
MHGHLSAYCVSIAAYSLLLLLSSSGCWHQQWAVGIGGLLPST